VVYVANESPTDVYFDDLSLKHERLVWQENNYYPFGMAIAPLDKKGEPDHRFKYTGKEEEKEWAVTDFGWRRFDHQLGRWHAVDKLAEQYITFSPYHYGANNPIVNVDVDGNRFTDAAQEWVDALLAKVHQKKEQANTTISSLNKIGEERELTKKESKVLRKATQQVNDLDDVIDEVRDLLESNQLYDVIDKKNSTNSSGKFPKESGEAFYDNQGTGTVKIYMNRNSILDNDRNFNIFSHELHHAYQFEIGRMSLPYDNEPKWNKKFSFLHDQYDEFDAYRRGMLFGGQTVKNISDVAKIFNGYTELPNTQVTIHNHNRVQAAISNALSDNALTRLAKTYNYAFRVNNTTYSK